jgi:phosphatidylglycerophosphatase A
MKNWNKVAIMTCISFFGTGLISKRMPGTIGSLFATILLIFTKPDLIPYIFVIFLVTGLYCCSLFFKQKDADLSDKDPGFIVIDEACGIYCCGIFLASVNHLSMIDFALSFFLFRFFDILKPWPIKQVEYRLKQGIHLFRINVRRAQNRNVNDRMAVIGIMIDDIMAAVYAILVHAVYIYLTS